MSFNMNINPLVPNVFNVLSNDAAFTAALEKEGLTTDSFADILTGSLKAAAETDAIDKTSAIELLIGKSDDLSGLLLDAQKAEISLNLALQIRNKVIDAYTEIMRMSV